MFCSCTHSTNQWINILFISNNLNNSNAQWYPFQKLLKAAHDGTWRSIIYVHGIWGQYGVFTYYLFILPLTSWDRVPQLASNPPPASASRENFGLTHLCAWLGWQFWLYYDFLLSFSIWQFVRLRRRWHNIVEAPEHSASKNKSYFNNILTLIKWVMNKILKWKQSQTFWFLFLPSIPTPVLKICPFLRILWRPSV